MSSLALRRLLGVVALSTALVAGAATVVPTTATAAPVGCRMLGTLPAKIVVNRADVIFYSTLETTAACRGHGALDADAEFDGPQGLSDLAEWTNSGDRYRFDQFAFITHAGTYRLEDGAALLFDSDFNEIPVTWLATKTSIRFGSRITKPSTSRTSKTHVKVSAKVQRYATSQSYVGDRATVYLQRRASSWKTYHAFKTLKSNSAGTVSYSYRTTTKYHYRLVVKDTSTVWGSTSVSSYR